jgi:Uma2 family endonuclease
MTVAFRFTSTDLKRLPEIPGVRYEIIDGDLYVSRQPTEDHQYTTGVFNAALHGWSIQTGLGLSIPAPGLVFAEDQDVILDLVWISNERRAQARDARGHYRIAPELVIEVLSPGRAHEVRDREIKLQLYSRQGVREYWIANWQQHTVEVYRHGDAGLQLATALSDGDVLTSPLLPGFSCPIATLWAPAVDESR